jgi:RNA polymerase I-specific transcription initiation factor RRN3
VVFYFAVQCVAYVICWRGRRWRRADFDPQARWRLRELINNPMCAGDAIDRNTAEMFRRLGIIEAAPETVVIERIAVWFPFDPCPLAEIADLVGDRYVTWGEVEADSDDVDNLLDQALGRVCQRRVIAMPDEPC